MSPAILPDPLSDAQRWSLLRGVLLSATAGKVCLCLDPSELPSMFPNAVTPIALRPDTLVEFRRAVYKFAGQQGITPERQQQLMTAAGEAAMNAVQHGGGGEASLCVGPHRTVQIWIRDRGALSGGPAGTDSTCTGYGWWLIVGAVDRVWLCPDPTGTVVVLEQERADRETERRR